MYYNNLMPYRSKTDAEHENSSYVISDTLRMISDSNRHIFLGVFVVITIASIIGNVSVIAIIAKRKYHYIQKTCIISLAISDLLSTVVISLNNLKILSHPLINWDLGEFLCYFIPMCQFGGITASSVALVVIAMDRYRNVVHALNRRWNPPLIYCIIGTLVLWAIVLGVSYPMYTFFSHQPITIIYAKGTKAYIEKSYICASFVKPQLTAYYVWMTIIIFLPLLLIFIWFYYNIAALIWRLRKPSDSAATSNNNNKATYFDNNSTSNTKTTEISGKNQLNSIDGLKSANMSKKRNMRVERKIRTFKIIVTIMIAFIVCRLPYYIFFIIKLKYAPGGESMWILNYAFVALNVFSCVLNPLLYTFLKQTVRVVGRIRKSCSEFVWKVCCCCCSTAEFEEYEKQNAFMVDAFKHHGAVGNCRKESEGVQDDGKRNSRVKFDDNQQLPRYSQFKKY